jgi:hypothetical protein
MGVVWFLEMDPYSTERECSKKLVAHKEGLIEGMADRTGRLDQDSSEGTCTD